MTGRSGWANFAPIAYGTPGPIVASVPEPLRSLAPSVPLGIVTPTRVSEAGGERWGLRYLEDCSVKEVAGLVGIPEGTVKTYLFRARDILRQRLERWLGGEAP